MQDYPGASCNDKKKDMLKKFNEGMFQEATEKIANGQSWTIEAKKYVLLEYNPKYKRKLMCPY